MTTAEHKFQKLVFKPENDKLVDFLDEFRKLAKGAFGIAAHAIIEQLRYAKMPTHLKKSLNQAHFENGTYEQIVTHLEKELELNGFEALDELEINTASHNTANTNADRPKPTDPNQSATTLKKPAQYRNQCRLLKRQKEQSEDTPKNPRNKNSGANTSLPNNNTNKNNNNNSSILSFSINL